MLASGNSKNLKSVTGIMEQEQHERNRGVVKEDLISELPEELLLHILSSLPTKRVIATSVLSKRWRSLWKMVPKLEFNSNFHYTHQFSENVGRTLFSHKAPVLESFHLKVSGRYSQSRACDEIDIGVWTEIAFERHVRELVLELCSERCVRFPISMFSFSTTLETLILKYSVLVDVPSPVCMKSLRTLHLESVDFKDSESIRNLISGCPNLEELVIYQCYRKDVVLTFTIVAPFLKRLVITDYFVGSENGGYVINAPSLKYLTLKGVSHYGCCLIENVPMLVEAKIREVSYIANENIVGSLTSVKRLFLDVSPLEIKFPTDSIFYQLVHLKMHTRREEWWNLLMLMLNSSPKLQFLKLTDEKRKFRKRGLVGRKWIEPKNVPECLLPHLKMFVWTRYRWESELEKEVATYILKNARQLKNASFSTRPIHSKEHHKLEERCKMVKELDGVVRASSSCHLVFVVDSVE